MSSKNNGRDSWVQRSTPSTNTGSQPDVPGVHQPSSGFFIDREDPYELAAKRRLQEIEKVEEEDEEDPYERAVKRMKQEKGFQRSQRRARRTNFPEANREALLAEGRFQPEERQEVAARWWNDGGEWKQWRDESSVGRATAQRRGANWEGRHPPNYNVESATRTRNMELPGPENEPRDISQKEVVQAVQAGQTQSQEAQEDAIMNQGGVVVNQIPDEFNTPKLRRAEVDSQVFKMTGEHLHRDDEILHETTVAFIAGDIDGLFTSHLSTVVYHEAKAARKRRAKRRQRQYKKNRKNFRKQEEEEEATASQAP